MQYIAAVLSVLAAVGAAAPAAEAVVPTQWIAKVTTESVGRAPSAIEWNSSLQSYETSGCTAAALKEHGVRAYTSTEFLNLGYDNAERLLALYRGALNREPRQNDIDTYLPRLNNATDPAREWNAVVNEIFDSAEFQGLVNKICNPATPAYSFDSGPAGDLKLWAGGLPSRTQAQLQAALNTAANQPCGTVVLRPKEVIRIGGDQPLGDPDEVPLYVPPCVRLTTAEAPTALSYARMARLVPNGPNAMLCSSPRCDHAELVQIGDGARLSRVWVDGKGLSGQNGKSALVGVASGSTATWVIDNRLSDPAANGTAVRAAGYGTTGTPCASRYVSRNLITGYATGHGQTQFGKARWVDGLSIFCEQAWVVDNDLVDITDAGITIYGSWNSAAEQRGVQSSTVTRNQIVSAGNSAYVAVGADAVGECLSNATGPPVSCIEFSHDRPYPPPRGSEESERSFVGASVGANTFWTGPRTHFDAGLMIGSASTFGDNGPAATGVSFTNNTTGGVRTRVHMGIAVSGMHATVLAGNTGDFAVVDAAFLVTEDKCPRGEVLYDSRTSGFVSPPPGAVDSPALYHCSGPHPHQGGMDWIKVGANARTLVGEASGERLNPWGHNFGDHKVTVADLREVKEMGANVVRLHLQFKDFISPDCTTANQAALGELRQTVQRAEENSVYLDITGLASYAGDAADPPCYTQADEAGRWAAQAKFWSEIARTVKDSPAVLAFDLMNEPRVVKQDQPCWAIGADPVNNPPCGEPHNENFFVQNITKDLCLDQPPATCARTEAEVTKAWVSRMTAAIRGAPPGGAGDTKHLITVGCATAGGKDATCSGLGPATLAPDLDYLSVHLYPEDCTGPAPEPDPCTSQERSSEQASQDPLTQERDLLKKYFDTGDPVVVEETYPLRSNAELVSDLILDSHNRGYATGWIGFWDERTLSQVTVDVITAPDLDLAQRVRHSKRASWGRAFQSLTSTVAPCRACQP